MVAADLTRPGPGMHSPDSVLDHDAAGPRYTPLMHELLLSLVGHTGDIFVTKVDVAEGGQMAAPWACNVAVANDIDLLTSSER